ncbi:AAA family ATPase [Corynebacterium cystitidis]|uniref:Predicted ATPase n=1 Tax=Corynebacterium cystitidis DSM 20524 TaxID=1121357 RepID=A0A1H9VMX9_9CORY|nr:ATP-binding protein [Corynebacterium cystitidis]WJY82915.1 Vitamin B12 import ATP-binding protein BtuD [Corynebacterium cystitidis DSM 20524]SES22553.1 Predicted ATPase [Corynebacterium cystitidis DSM 20524]SNV69138.1 Predicted ATPase [Corynebacterium cystitidis]
MRIKRINATNWRNFSSIEAELGNRLFVVGPNASGKSNFLDIFRFLADVAKPGGGLASALEERGGWSAVRNLNARNTNHGAVTIQVDLEDHDHQWSYLLTFRSEQAGNHRPIVSEEKVKRDGQVILNRPQTEDESDPELLTQTHLEQIASNRAFRPIADFFASISYFHISPQAIRQANKGPKSDDPYGSGFLAAINATPEKTRNAWLDKIQTALTAAVPDFETLKLETDPSGQPHLIAGFKNWRKSPTHQNEAAFSDGTLRLIGLLWAVISKSTTSGLLLLEEPEISLNAAIVRVLPSMLATAQRGTTMQVVMTTHSPDLLDDEGIHPNEVLVLKVGDESTTASLLGQIDNPEAQALLAAPGLTNSDVVERLIDPIELRPLIQFSR